jgi:hypothetical protein
MFKKFKLILILILIFIVIFIFNFFDKSYNILFIEKSSNKNLMSFKLKEGEVFQIKFKHSVALTDVTEWYRIESGKIVLFETDFYDQCAGLPTEPYGDEKLILDGGIFKLINLKREFSEIIYGINYQCNYRLLIKNREINLSQKFGDKILIIKIRRF